MRLRRQSRRHERGKQLSERVIIIRKERKEGEKQVEDREGQRTESRSARVTDEGEEEVCEGMRREMKGENMSDGEKSGERSKGVS